MSPHAKEGEEGDAYTKQKLIHKTTDIYKNKQRCRDGVINEFLFWCRHPLVPLLFHEVTSLHPLSFQRNDFPLVPHIFQFWAKP